LRVENERSLKEGDMGIEAMVVTRQTRGNAEKINRWRKEKGLSVLDIVEVKMELAEDGEPISSKRIRVGEIDRGGEVFGKHKLWGKLPKSMRAQLRKPLGKIIEERDFRADMKNKLIITIGDVSTKRLIEEGIKPSLVVFDLRVQRKKVFKGPEELGVGKEYTITKLKNPAGEVSKALFEYFAITHPYVRTERSNIGSGIPPVGGGVERYALWIEGGEDLAVLPAVLFAPLGTIVVYGQPQYQTYLEPEASPEYHVGYRAGSLALSRSVGTGQAPLREKSSGLVIVEVTEEKKREVFDLLSKFKK
jgi:hypothetical protein